MQQKNKKKVIFVAVAVGRSGSSMVTGILERLGANAGINPCPVKSVVNPGGFYEVSEVRDFYYRHYFDHMNPFTPMFSDQKLRELKSTLPEFLSIIESTYAAKYPLVIKALDYLPIASFEDDDRFDVRVICLRRDLVDQAKSISSMWSNKGPKLHWWREWLHGRYKWTEHFREAFDFKYADFDFNQILDNPHDEAIRMAHFCGLPMSNVDEVEKWVDPRFSRSRS